MLVYVILSESAHGVEIEEIFTTKVKAESYLTELEKQNPYYFFRIEEHWAI